MRASLVFFFSLTIIGCQPSEHNTKSGEIDRIDEFLGKDKAKAFADAEDLFLLFLNDNYPNEPTHEKQIEHFLNDLAADCDVKTDWQFRQEATRDLIKEWEDSGLRKEIWIYNDEDYAPKNDLSPYLSQQERDSIYEISEEQMEKIIDDLSFERDTSGLDKNLKNAFREGERRSLRTNIHGDYLFALAKFARKDPFIQGYIDFKAPGNNISFCILSSTFLNHADLSDPLVYRILVAELFFPIIYNKPER